MAAPNEKLAESLDVLKALQEGGHRVFRSDDFSSVHRERLVENGFLQDVMKGWISPNVTAEKKPWPNSRFSNQATAAPSGLGLRNSDTTFVSIR
jgi:hypothetical protein